MRSAWKALAGGALLLAAASILVSVILFVTVSGYTRTNCLDNLAQDRALAGLVEASLNASQRMDALTKEQVKAKRRFERYVERVRNAPPCPGGKR